MRGVRFFPASFAILGCALTAPASAQEPPAQPAPAQPVEPAPVAPAPSAEPSTPAETKPTLITPPVVGASVGREGRFRYANTWDLNLEGGAGYVLDVEKWTGFVRARPGVLLVRNDSFYQFGATAEYLGLLRRPAFGAQAEYLHLQLGVWAQIGAAIDTKGRPGGMASVGLSLFGFEAQVREFDQTSDLTFALIGKVRIPIGILVYGLRTR